MKKLLLSLAAAGTLMGCSGSGKTDVTDSLLWKISGNGLDSPSYLLGTHHFASLDVLDGYPSYTDALVGAGKVVGELDMSDLTDAQDLFLTEGSMPPGVTYHDILSPEDYDKLDELLTGFFGVGLEQFGGLKPSMLATMYTQFSYLNVDPSFNPMMHVPIDSYVQDLGREKGKQVIGLETVEEQVNLLMNFEPLETQAAVLICTLENDEKMTEALLELTRLYKEGELARMHKLAFESDDDPCAFSEEFQLALIKLRNDRWMQQIPGLINDGSTFIAVGALHLTGEWGLISRLTELGYSVEPIR